jgi:hypothetical protein
MPFSARTADDAIFSRPLPLAQQQFAAFGAPVASASSPQGWGGFQFEIKITKPLPEALQQFQLWPPFPYAAGPSNFLTLAEYILNPEIFAKPFPVSSMPDRADMDWAEPPTLFIANPWEELSYSFTKPFPTAHQQYLAAPTRLVPTLVAPDGWRGLHWDYAFTKPFPPASQVVEDYEHPIPTAATPQGWQGAQLDYRFSLPFPVGQQQFLTLGRQTPTAPTPQGWDSMRSEYRFTKPFPVALQPFDFFFQQFYGPPIPGPGAGKKRDIPAWYPSPAYDEAPRKPVKPVWDRGGRIEVPKPAEPQRPAGPPPLPPLSLFGSPAPMHVVSPNGLPTFREYVPQNAHATAQRIQEAQDESDAIAVLKALGLLGSEP